MYHIAYGILRDRYLAEDAVHDAFLKIIKYIPSISEVNCHKTRTLIVIIIKSTAIDIYRGRSRQCFLDEEALADEIDTGELPLDHIIADENYQELFTSLKGLKKEFLEIILLKYHYGYNNDEIGRLLCISEPAVRKRLSRARQEIRKKIGECEDGIKEND